MKDRGFTIATAAHRQGRSGKAWSPVAAVVLLLALIGWQSLAHAQEISPRTDGAAVDLHVGQGRLLRFNEPVESVLIADATIANLQIVAPDIVYVFGLKPGLTNLIAITSDQRIKASMGFRVSADPGPAQDAKSILQSTSTTDLTIFGNRIVALGQTRSVNEALDVDSVARTYSPPEYPPINNTTITGSQQVNIRVRFAEVSRTELQSYGVDWQVFVNQGDFNFGIFRTGGFQPEGGLGLNLDVKGINVEVLLDALQRNGIVKILAEPNLTAMTGQTASFLAGGEVPVPIPQSEDTIGVEYKPFGVSLGFTPTLINNQRIAIHVQPEVSSITDGGVSLNGYALPSFVVRRADTTVEVASGQTFAIAGLFQQRFSSNLEKFPVLGDVPILGALFQSQRYQREETELVILITPYLVEPVRTHDLATPMDRPAARRPSKKSAGMGLIIK
ncbi:type II and III secretion system protein family protein [Nitratireductor sp. ZSWI3]|uniref:type II and III secretion system protein family protein n=1 Tax=Nitratireductor sp. ZSWI3 TaxID=2966359 RepID=UPI00214F789A|nr:type II and III secretion system protein family protein [Nitratireductor sp. ZSWI3]MCR4264825.1 type II and III secretion system protein family protein [Nitratireductor sp. ZSWI3]